MLPLILLPLAVVSFLAVLLFLFFRRLPDVEKRAVALSAGGNEPLLSVSDRLKRLFLGMIERFARWFKTFSLKAHNRLGLLATSARAARLRAAERIAERKARREAISSKISFPAAPIRRASPLPTVPSIQEEPNRETPISPVEDGASDAPGRIEEEGAPVFSAGAPPVSSPLRRWFARRPEESPATPLEEAPETAPVEPDIRDERDEQAEPLVSEPLPPSAPAVDEFALRRRASDIGRRFGSAVRRLRTDRKPLLSSEEDPGAPIKKGQLEDILVERISLNPRDIEAYERLGDYYLEQGTLSDAKECYRQVLKLSPAYRLVKIKIRRLERLLEKERVS